MRISDWSSDVCSSDLFADDGFRAAFLGGLKARATSGLAYDAQVEATLDALAAHLERCLDLDRILAIAQGTPQSARSGRQQLEKQAFSEKVRSEERRGGKEGVSTCRSRGWADNE